jgi:hypothetical protein
MLNEALDTEVRFPKELSPRAMDAYLQSLTQIS